MNNFAIKLKSKLYSEKNFKSKELSTLLSLRLFSFLLCEFLLFIAVFPVRIQCCPIKRPFVYFERVILRHGEFDLNFVYGVKRYDL